MPPPLALFLCTAFVLGLLWLERKQAGEVSAATWIPTVWLMSTFSKSLGMWFGTAGSNEAGSQLDQIFLAGLTVAAMATLVRRRFDCVAALRRNGWLLALLAYFFASTLWSDIPAIVLRRVTREAIVVVMALVVISDTHPREALESVLRRAAYILLPVSLLLIKYYPALGVIYAPWSGMRMWAGVAGHKNSLGALCLVAAVFLLWAIYRRWRVPETGKKRPSALADLSVLVLALFLLRGEEGAYSATSLATTAVGVSGLAILFWLRWRKIEVSRVRLLALLLVLVGLGASAPFLEGSNVAFVSASLGRDSTLTGRTNTWSELVPVVMSRPLLGCGFESFWTTARQNYYEMSHGHNGYLDVMLTLGMAGFSLYVAWLLSCARRLHRGLSEDYEWASLGLCLLLMAVVYNTAESAFSNLVNGLTAVLVLLSSVAPSARIAAQGGVRSLGHSRAAQRRPLAAAPRSSAGRVGRRRPVSATSLASRLGPVSIACTGYRSK